MVANTLESLRPPHPDPNRGRASGNGLAGMRKRVTAAGGTLDAAPTGDGGYRVVALIPARRPAAAHG
jgi:glucose-6-phosphate-specific signal transduction histidine kinase